MCASAFLCLALCLSFQAADALFGGPDLYIKFQLAVAPRGEYIVSVIEGQKEKELRDSKLDCYNGNPIGVTQMRSIKKEDFKVLRIPMTDKRKYTKFLKDIPTHLNEPSEKEITAIINKCQELIDLFGSSSKPTWGEELWLKFHPRQASDAVKTANAIVLSYNNHGKFAGVKSAFKELRNVSNQEIDKWCKRCGSPDYRLNQFKDAVSRWLEIGSLLQKKQMEFINISHNVGNQEAITTQKKQKIFDEKYVKFVEDILQKNKTETTEKQKVFDEKFVKFIKNIPKKVRAIKESCTKLINDFPSKYIASTMSFYRWWIKQKGNREAVTEATENAWDIRRSINVDGFVEGPMMAFEEQQSENAVKASQA